MMIPFLIVLLTVECVIILVLLFVMLIERKVLKYDEQKLRVEKQLFSHLIEDCLTRGDFEETKWEVQSPHSQQILLSVLESFERRFCEEEWYRLKKYLTQKYLLPRARLWSTSYSWEKRNFSSRAFALCPREVDRDLILSLMDDTVFLVRSNAALASIRMRDKEGIEKVLVAMATEPGFAHDFYRDMLLNEQCTELSNIIQTIAEEKHDVDSILLQCLDLFSCETTTLRYPYLHRDLCSDNHEVRIAAMKVYANNPQEGSAEILLAAVEDEDADIRADAAAGLWYFASQQTVKKLEVALSDPIWKVRLEAAWSLKRMGSLGVKILERQSETINKRAFNTAQYALVFDW